jgi:phosphatidylglycerol---prolipoprotein diacylglyceryl transferase
VRQVLFHAGSLPIGTHDVFVFFGLSLAVLIFFYEAWRREMLSRDIIVLAGGTLFCGAIAAKVSTMWRYIGSSPDPSALGAFLYGGKSVLGGLAGAYIGAHVTKRLLGYHERTGDLFAPAVASGMAVGRWGCFFSETPGTPTTLPWGITLDEATAAHMPGCPANVPLHPSFIYEIAFHTVMFGVLWWLRPRMPVRGELFKIYLLAYAVFRFFVEFVRGNADLAFGLSGSQLFLIPSTLLLIAYFGRQLARDAYTVPAPIAPALVVED